MRRPLAHERPLIDFLFELAGIDADAGAIDVRPMADGGMGSLALAPFDASRQWGSVAAQCHFRDRDGAVVLAHLTLDQQGLPFEIDVWRTDFAATLDWPPRAGIVAGEPG
jgi:hypothetical protein